MKTVMLVFVMILFAGIAFSQSFKTGNFIRPAYEKAFASKVHIVKGFRGENQFAMMIPEATRNKYFISDGTGSFNKLLLLNNFRLEWRWDRSRNKCY